MSKQTAVEWIVEKIWKDNQPLEHEQKVIDQALAMEKEQHQQTAMHFFPTSLKKVDFEQYYNETYEK
jgi:hypothetical protein